MLPDIGLLGAKRAGKDTIADYLVEAYGYQKLSFAEPLRQLASEINPFLPDAPGYFNDVTEMFGYEYAKDNVPGYRKFLEDLGLGMRKILGPDVWVDKLLETYFASDPNQPTVVTDCRFPNEAEALYEQLFKLVHVTRKAAGPLGNHESELHVRGLAEEYHATPLPNESGDVLYLYDSIDEFITDFNDENAARLEYITGHGSPLA